MNSTQLWQQILAYPADEGLRSQYLAAMQEAGDPRAEMFRLAEELYHLVHGYFDKEKELTARYQPLEDQWYAEFEPYTARWNAEIRFVRGWPIELAMEARQFLQHGAEIIKILPIRHLNLRRVNETPEVFNCPFLAQIASINASQQKWGLVALSVLAAAPQLDSLRWLDLSDTGIEDSGIEMLAASPHLRQLAHLDLTKNPGRDPVDASCGCGIDGFSGYIVAESIWLPEFGRELEAKYGPIQWLHALGNFMEKHPPSRYQF